MGICFWASTVTPATEQKSNQVHTIRRRVVGERDYSYRIQFYWTGLNIRHRSSRKGTLRNTKAQEVKGTGKQKTIVARRVISTSRLVYSRREAFVLAQLKLRKTKNKKSGFCS